MKITSTINVNLPLNQVVREIKSNDYEKYLSRWTHHLKINNSKFSELIENTSWKNNLENKKSSISIIRVLESDYFKNIILHSIERVDEYSSKIKVEFHIIFKNWHYQLDYIYKHRIKSSLKKVIANLKVQLENRDIESLMKIS